MLIDKMGIFDDTLAARYLKELIAWDMILCVSPCLPHDIPASKLLSNRAYVDTVLKHRDNIISISDKTAKCIKKSVMDEFDGKLRAKALRVDSYSPKIEIITRPVKYY